MNVTCLNLVKAVSSLARKQGIDYRSLFTNNSALRVAPRLNESTKSDKTEEKPSGLMEFFDVKENWVLNEVRVGRSWRKEDLRIKSNQDLHKLWFVLLKERNMLLTMEHACKENVEVFPSPERIDKVKESMVNLEEVVRERNRAYYMLETGETGERTGKVAQNRIGMRYFYKKTEHSIPEELNSKWRAKVVQWYNRRECVKFFELLNEQKFIARKREKVRERNHILQLLKRYPDLDLNLLKQEYPEANIDKLKYYRKARGHSVPT